MGIQAEVQCAVRASGIPLAKQFRHWAEALPHQSEVSVCIRVVGEGEMAELNARYRGKSGPTNVLAFEASEDERAKGYLGDLVICAPEVLREAREYGCLPEARFAHMMVHGLLHLLGHDHEEASAAARMEQEERSAMQHLGYPDPYEALQ